ncbi:MAG: hypothetical protein U0984_13780 [Prosthecobacter sp.]|nr:hypothetical protein [Prosthecobacter sp.]
MTQAHEEIVNFLAAGSTSRSLLEFQPSSETRERVEALIRKEKTTGLLPEERQELEGFMHLEHLMRLAKAKARTLVAGE